MNNENFRIQAAWSFQQTQGHLNLTNAVLHKRVSFPVCVDDCTPVVGQLFVGGTRLRITQLLSELSGAAPAEAEQLFESLAAKGIFIRAKALDDLSLTNTRLDRTTRFLNTFEGEGRSGEDMLRDLQRSSVLLVGLGSYGSVIAEALLRLGVGRLIAYDFDVVEESNLDRQSLYTRAQVGMRKAEAAKATLQAIGSSTQLEIHHKKIQRIADLEADIQRADLIINTFGFLSNEYEVTGYRI